MTFEAVKDQYAENQWRVESFGPDGEAYIVLFPEPLAEARAKSYVVLQNFMQHSDYDIIHRNAGAFKTTIYRPSEEFEGFSSNLTSAMQRSLDLMYARDAKKGGR